MTNEVSELIEPKEIQIGSKTFILSKVPSMTGRKLAFLYVPSAIPIFKMGDYKVNEECAMELLSYAAVPRGNGLLPQRLLDRTLIENHTTLSSVLALEKAMAVYNFHFLPLGKCLDSLTSFFQNIEQKTTRLLTKSLEQLSAAVSRHTES